MGASLIHFRPEQKKRLVRQARTKGKSLSQEVRDAVDFYLEVPPGSEKELAGLAAEARRATERMIEDLDDAIASVRRSRKQWEKRR